MGAASGEVVDGQGWGGGGRQLRWLVGGGGAVEEDIRAGTDTARDDMMGGLAGGDAVKTVTALLVHHEAKSRTKQTVGDKRGREGR